MRVDCLHRRIVKDVLTLHDVVEPVFPAELPTQYGAHSLNLKSFLDRLNTVTSPLNVFNEHKEDTSLPQGRMFQTGLWVGHDERPENGSDADVRVIWHTHPDTKRLHMNQPKWNQRRFYFWEMVMHELVHRYQDVARPDEQNIRIYRTRSTIRNVKEEQAYYGNFDEIEAHSHNAALELFLWWGHMSLRDAVHEAITHTGRLIPTYCFYVATFEPSHPAMKHFKRKVKAWYAIFKKYPECYHIIQLPKLI